MKLNKLTKTVLVAGMVLTVGVGPVLAPKSAEAATVVSATKNETVITFTKAEIAELVGTDFTVANVRAIYNSLKSAATWEAAGYSSADASLVAARFANSSSQAIGILTDIAYGTSVDLKIVVINSAYYQGANIGTSNSATAPEVTEPEVTEPEVTEPEAPEVTDPTEPEVTTPEANKAPVKDIEIDIEYKKKDIELDYEVKSNGTVKAKYVNEFTGEKIEGKVAQAKIEGVLAGLDVKNSSKSDIAKHVLAKLNAGSDYKKFQFEVKYADKSKVEFKLK
ncbi:YusW family protein [Carnobacterium gallinarum]|uniref:YusW family protein n=1 Tax=Carnobacterium gallinarum TaxID=2749 RepID=UPI00054CF795|nr:YusW family protein [Carnobacterium gallinarum]